MTQKTDILKHLEAGKSLTPLGALNSFGCMRLAARISDLRGDGHAIEVKMVKVSGRDRTPTRVANYYMPATLGS